MKNKKLNLLFVLALLVICVPFLIAGGWQIGASKAKTSAADPIAITVRNTAGESLSAGDVVVWQTDTDLSSTDYAGGLQLGVDITTPTAQAQEHVAGVMLDATTDTNYGRMAVSGIVDINVNYSNTAVGDVLVSTTMIKSDPSTADHASGTVVDANMGDEGGFAIVLEVVTDSSTAYGILLR